MTVDELTKLVESGNSEKLIAAMAHLDESERKKLAKAAVALQRAAKSMQTDAFRQAIAVRHAISSDDPKLRDVRDIKGTAELAVLGLCAWSQARRVSPSFWGLRTMGEKNPILRVLLARRPEWIDQWVQQQLDGRFCDWPTIRSLIREGACQRPTDDAYIVWMIREAAGSWWQRDVGLTKLLRADRRLLEYEIWRIFEVDLTRPLILSREDRRPSTTSWRESLITLSNSGELDRQRLLTMSLQALNRQIHPGNTAWFCDFHEAMSPTIGERVQRQSQYVDLLSSSVPAVVGFALSSLKTVARAKQLDVKLFVSAAGTVLDLRQKKHPLAALQLLRLAGEQSPKLNAQIACTAVHGLNHPFPEIQKACVDLIESCVAGPDAAVADAIESRLDSVAASHRDRVEKLLAKAQGASAPRTPVTIDEPKVVSIAEIESIPLHWRALAGVDSVEAAIKNQGQLPRLEFDPMTVPRLDAATRLTPIKDLDELIDRASSAVEKLDSSEELELLLDGMSRLADVRPEDFGIRTAPLLKRLTDLEAPRKGGNQWFGVHSRLGRLILCWLRKQPLGPVPGKAAWFSVSDFLSARMEKLSIRTMALKAGPMLACPTHKNGWIDPRELVRRFRAWQEGVKHDFLPKDLISEHTAPDVFDLIQALLRLAPDFRKQALADARSLQGEGGAAVRFALGGEERVGRQAGLWIAAARARDPWGIFPELESVHGNLGPDGAIPATIKKMPWQKALLTGATGLSIEVAPAVTHTNCLVDRPLAMLNRPKQFNFFMTTQINIRSELAVWPAKPDGALAEGAIHLADRLHAPASTFSPLATYLEPLFDPDLRFSEMTQLALAMALLSKDPGARGLAIDALISLITDGRCTGEELGSVFANASDMKGLQPLNRLATALSDVARISALHRHVSIQVITSMIANMHLPAPEDLHYLLTPLYQWLLMTGEALPDECRPLLNSIAGKGKTAKLAQTLLGLSENSDRSHRRVALAEALNGRIERVRRWANQEGHL